MADLTYAGLLSEIRDIVKHTNVMGERLKERARSLEESAKDTSSVAEMIAAMNVDKDTVSEAQELAKITSGLSQATIKTVGTCDTAQRQAIATGDQARTTHGGINERVNRSTVSGIHNVSRDWFEQQ
ncbi:hypothetical protein ABT282_31125 [Streptomyces sp. NPDC000927]|uniref:hypothetical protein n=1 Tax=Streptomyces sp. NPDC000927 TaxID=3154371 RepID=UPI00331A6CAE